jgi:Leucine-rich repeat (LRR) protein
LSSNDIGYDVPGDLFAKLTTLRNLDLSRNNLTDFRIPTTIGYLTDLTSLNLGSANVAGTIPTQLALLTKLVIIDLHKNALTGTIPPLPRLNLERSTFTFNFLEGDIDCNLYLLAPEVDCDRVKCNCCEYVQSSTTGIGIGSCTLVPPLNSSVLAGAPSSNVVSPQRTATPTDFPGPTGEFPQPEAISPPVSDALLDFLARSSADGGIALLTAGASQQKAMEWLQSELMKNSTIAFNHLLLQTYALATLYYQWELIRIDPPWLRGTDACSWGRVSCNQNLKVSSLDLKYTGAGGEIPAELWFLTAIDSLDIQYCGFSGAIPSEIGAFAQLSYFDAAGNSFTGSPPPELFQLSSLTHLDFSFNWLSGTLSTSIGLLTSLEYLQLSFNGINGTIPLELGHLKHLSFLDLDFTRFSGMLPSEFGELTQLTLLRLGNAALIGTVPTETGLLRDLTELGIYNNQLSGTLFSELVFLTSLTKLDVSGNHFVGTVFSELGFLTDLTSLSLRSNHFSGTIFTEIGLLISLESFLFDSNQFSGVLPTELGNLPTGYCKWCRLLLFVNFTGTCTYLFRSLLTITGCKQIYQYIIRA